MNNLDLLTGAKILLLGSSGFIGSHLLERLLSRSAKIVLPIRNIDKLQGRVSNLIDHKAVTIVDFESFIGDSKKMDFDFVFNASGFGVNPDERDFLEMFYVNSFIPIILVDKLQNNSTCFIQIGSGSEYKDKKNSSHFLENDPKTDSGLYSLSKKFSSEYLIDVARGISMPMVSLKLFNIFGPGENPHRLFPSIYSKLSKNKEINLSDGNQIRDFLYIEDAVNAILHVACVCKKNNIIDEVNICSGNGISVKDFAKKIANKMNLDSRLLKFGKIQRRDTDYDTFVGDLNKLKDKYSWQPKHDLSSGINLYLKFLIDNE